MKASAALFSIAASIAFTAIHAAASTHAAAPKEPLNPAQTVTPVFQTGSSAESTTGSPASSHLFPVNDERGLLLTCVAPDIDTNRETDLFTTASSPPAALWMT
jgi:hypothetical protein